MESHGRESFLTIAENALEDFETMKCISSPGTKKGFHL